jgi:pyruvate dehydrogenase E1 component alpha subunit
MAKQTGHTQEQPVLEATRIAPANVDPTDVMCVDVSGEKPSDMADDILIRMYEEMVQLRQFDRRSVSLQRAGRIGTYPPLEGQEACQVGSTLALRKQDFVVPTYRDYGAMILHGVPMEHILLYWNGRAEGCVIPNGVNVFPIAVPIATQLPHAAGIAWAAKLRGQDQIALGFFGDGASSEGDFHEAMNFAGVFHLPVIYFCENNQYAISVPYARQTATATIAEKAAAYGVEGVRVNGSDAIEVYRTVRRAVQKAAQGGGPTLIEALTYRYGAHTTSDDPTKYRTAQEGEAWKARDPIMTLQSQLLAWGLWDDTREQDLQTRIDAEISSAIAKMEAAAPPSPEDLFQHVYARPTKRLLEQQAELLSMLKSSTGGQSHG